MIIREVMAEDAGQFLEMLRELDNETRFMMYEPGERMTTVPEQREVIEEGIGRGDPLFLAEEEGQVIGFIEGVRGEYRRIKHSLYIAMGVLKDYRGMGAGSALMKRMDEWAGSNGVKRMELTVICTNERAVKLYKDKGFQVEGVKKASLKVEGRYVDEYYMGKIYQERGGCSGKIYSCKGKRI